jgi:ligand-binding sensor domain-containing protein/serine phosphatase RsbU (regulator of sigma subunit)
MQFLMRIWKFIFFVIIFSVVSKLLISQIIPFQNYTVKNGLPSNVVYDIEQDQKGFIWLATQVGAVKFDGYNFTTYTIDNGLPDNNIIDILIDSKNRIWFGTESGGIAVMINNTITSFSVKSGLISDNVKQLFEDKKGNIWCITYNGFSIITSDTILNYDNLNSPIDNEILCTYISKNGTVWLSTIKGVYYYDTLLHSYKNIFIKNQIVRDIEEDEENSYWFATQDNGVVHIDKKGISSVYNIFSGMKSQVSLSILVLDKDDILVGTYKGGICQIKNGKVITKPYNKFQNYVIVQLLKDRHGRIWGQTDENGVLLLDGNKIQHISVKNSLVDDRITSLYEDFTGNIWMTSINGLSKYGKTIFEIYNQNLVENDKNIVSIASQNGIIYAGSYSGLNILKPDLSIEKYNSGNGLPEDPDILSIFPGKNSEIWLGTYKGLTLYKNNRYLFYPDQLFNTKDFPIVAHDIEISSDNTIYTATQNGIVLFKNGKYFNINAFNDSISSDVWNIAFDENGNLWCATKSGLQIYDGNLFHAYDTANGIPDIYCNDVAFDKVQYCWLATDKGISRIKLNNDFSIECRNISTKEGLASDIVLLIKVDKRGYIWAGHNKGLDRINPNDYSIRHYAAAEGFLPVETSLGAATLTSGDDIWFGSVDGAVRYMPENDIDNIDPPKVYITGIELFNDTSKINRFASGIDSNSLLPVNLVLKYNKNNLVFHYVGLHYTIVEKNKYKYFLDGYDNSWSEATTEIQTPPYRKLPAGYYTFRILASNCDGIWTKEPALFSFEIKPPFWKTLWFYLIEGIVFLAIFLLIIRIRERKLRHDKRVLAQKVKERTLEVEQQRDQITLQKEEIMDSIIYAQRIQKAVLPKKEFIDNLLPEYFILFKPRDIVSGDFYWLSGNKNKVVLVAADCTGHGVPGALMSMLGVSILNEVGSPEKLPAAGKILDILRDHLTTTLWQTGDEQDAKDGMDIALCIIDFEKNTIEFSGAYNPLVHIRNKEIETYKGDKMPVGIHIGEKKPFNTSEIKIQKNDCIYVFSDGYADQFGGTEGKKFKSVPFRELLVEISHLSMDEQKIILEESIEKWKGSNEQVDDILVIGVRI